MCSIVCRETNFVCCFLARIGGLDSERRLYRANDGTESLLPDNAESEPRPNAASPPPWFRVEPNQQLALSSYDRHSACTRSACIRTHERAASLSATTLTGSYCSS